MPNVNTIKIPLNRILFLRALFFCGICLLLICFSLTKNDNSFLPVALIYVKNILAILGVVLFGTLALLVVMRLLRLSDGLFITEEGITDKSSAAASTPIKWSEISKVETRVIRGQSIMSIYLKYPQEYIAHEPNPLRRLVMRHNMKYYGSPAHIATANVKSSPDELQQLISSRLDAHRTI